MKFGKEAIDVTKVDPEKFAAAFLIADDGKTTVDYALKQYVKAIEAAKAHNASEPKPVGKALKNNLF
jgi:hypothetical protein